MQLTGGDIFWNGAGGVAANGGNRPEFYGPGTWSSGSSYRHLDETTFPAGNANSLMTPLIGQAEVIHDPGVITLGMFGDVGWALGCSYSINPTSATVAAVGATGSVTVTGASGWSAASNDAWITVRGGASGTGNGTRSYAVAANTGAARAGTITIAGQTFTVTQSMPFIDDPLTTRTQVKVVHFTELRTRINALRVGCGLSAFVFTDATLTAGSTTIQAQAVHVTELRTAMNQAYVGCGQSAPTYTDATLPTGQMVIKAVHIEELRAAVIALE